MEICNVIKERRKELGLTQVDLAKAVGVTRITIVEWERGKNLPSLKNLKALEAALEFPPGSLLIMTSYGDKKGEEA